MPAELDAYLLRNGLFSREDRLLLAISGGLDSVVLAHLLATGGFDFSMAHCNFGMRGTASDGDELFCRQLAQQLNVPFFAESFDVPAHRNKTGQSVQMAARELRYNWFGALMQREQFDYLVTAHHANDLVESVLLNLLRGTGIKGMKGIAPRIGNRVRPLLDFTKEQLQAYATKNNIAYRTDESNSDDKYERNFLRLHVVPKLKELNTDLERTFLGNSRRFTEESGIVDDYVRRRADELCFTRPDGVIQISRNLLARESYPATLLHALLSDYGFNETQQGNLLANIQQGVSPGKAYFSATHEISLDRNDVLLRKRALPATEIFHPHSLEELAEIPGFIVTYPAQFSSVAVNELFVSRDRLVFPLTLRPWQKGDRFKPFGMDGYKLVSDYLREQKLSSFDKDACRLLVNGNGEIIWLAGFRSDERYRVRQGEDDLIKITLIER